MIGSICKHDQKAIDGKEFTGVVLLNAHFVKDLLNIFIYICTQILFSVLIKETSAVSSS